MKFNDFFKSMALAFLLVILSHLAIRFGGMTLFHYGSLGLMPGSIIELALSSDPHRGFGDWRTAVVVNIASWLIYSAAIFIVIRTTRLFSR